MGFSQIGSPLCIKHCKGIVSESKRRIEFHDRPQTLLNTRPRSFVRHPSLERSQREKIVGGKTLAVELDRLLIPFPSLIEFLIAQSEIAHGFAGRDICGLFVEHAPHQLDRKSTRL